MTFKQKSKKRIFDLESEILEVIGKRTTDVSSITYLEINTALINVLNKMNYEERKGWYNSEVVVSYIADYSGEINKVDHENILKMGSLLECSNYSKEVGNEK
ncbi:hypothetical protein [Pedobacter sp. B4-66]|uniref:hypothetical protein n=1 Tax=Pedobacter sp. B4-66 TaxID=2817280 RepID=UPI001BDAFF9E|nr:hypothetical protein [Pedobacter sp. B4-66]